MSPKKTRDDLLVTIIENNHKEVMSAVKDLKVEIFGGDGRTGALPFLKAEHDSLEAKVDTAATAMDARVKAVEQKVWYASGFGAAIGAVLSFVGFKTIHHG